METVLQGVFIGIVATMGTDVWAIVAKHMLRLPTADWAAVGRWFGHMPRGVFIHRSIADAAPIPNELAIGWIMHYATGIVYGVGYLVIVQILLDGGPTLISALVFGLVTLAAPWLIMQPGMGAGVCASKTSNPGIVRLVNSLVHVVFGLSLYAGWLLI